MSKKYGKRYESRSIISLKDMLKKSVEQYGDHAAFKVRIEDDRFKSVSYIEYQNDVNAIGTALINLGLKGKTIAVIGENSYKWCVSYLAVVNGTGIVVPLDKELPHYEIKNLLERSHASAIFYSGKSLDNINKVFSELPSLEFCINMDLLEVEGDNLSFDTLLEKGKKLISEGNTVFSDAKINVEEMSMLLFTSGTTDNSKGVMLSHKNICADMMTVGKVIYADTKDSILSILPLHHTYECTCGFLEMLNLGVTISFCEGIRHIAKNLRELQPSIIMAVPLILENVYNKIVKTAKKNKQYTKLRIAVAVCGFLYSRFRIDIRKKVFKDVNESLGGNLRLIISGAAALNPKVSKTLRAMGLDIMQGYGLTECSPIVSVNQMDYYKDASAGQALPDVEVKVVDKDENGIGEIIVKGDNVMLGYYKDEEATKNVLKDDWFYTGDFGYIDNDGFIFISGRKKNVIVTKNGKNIFPEDVELYLNQSIFIKESIVYGVDEEDDSETIVCAQIVPDMEIISEQYSYTDPSSQGVYQLIKDEVKKANKKLISYKKVKRFDIRSDEFEKTTTKKIKRHIELPSFKKLQETVMSKVDGVKDIIEDKIKK